MSQTLTYLSGFPYWALTLEFDIGLDVERAWIANERSGSVGGGEIKRIGDVLDARAKIPFRLRIGDIGIEDHVGRHFIGIELITENLAAIFDTKARRDVRKPQLFEIISRPE